MQLLVETYASHLSSEKEDNESTIIIYIYIFDLGKTSTLYSVHYLNNKKVVEYSKILQSNFFVTGLQYQISDYTIRLFPVYYPYIYHPHKQKIKVECAFTILKIEIVHIAQWKANERKEFLSFSNWTGLDVCFNQYNELCSNLHTIRLVALAIMKPSAKASTCNTPFRSDDMSS